MPSLTTEQHDSILLAARPLAPHRREAFIAQVETALQTVPMVGDGAVYRAIAENQRLFFDAPKFADRLSAPRQGR